MPAPLRDLVDHDLVASGRRSEFDVTAVPPSGANAEAMTSGVVVHGVRGARDAVGVAVASQRPENAQLDAQRALGGGGEAELQELTATESPTRCSTITHRRLWRQEASAGSTGVCRTTCLTQSRCQRA